MPCWFFWYTGRQWIEKGGGAAAQQAAEAWLEGVNVHMREWKGATSSQLETGLAGCFPYVSPERPPARRLQLGEFCL